MNELCTMITRGEFQQVGFGNLVGFWFFFTATVPLQSELVHLVEPGHCQPTQRGGVHSDNAVNIS